MYIYIAAHSINRDNGNDASIEVSVSGFCLLQANTNMQPQNKSHVVTFRLLSKNNRYNVATIH